MKRFGFELLVDQAAAWLWDMMPTPTDVAGDSEIEKLLIAAVYTRTWIGDGHHYGVVRLKDAPKDQDGTSELAKNFIFFEQQVEINSIGRVDFVFHALDRRPGILKPPGWRKLIVECDGHDFHERTKEQAKRDRSRDRRALLHGIEVMRFTGSEIWNDPWGCAGEVLQWCDGRCPQILNDPPTCPCQGEGGGR